MAMPGPVKFGQPAESTNIIIVGGTTLSMNGSGSSYLLETVWNSGNLGRAWGPNGSGNDYWGSGGGVCPDYMIPYWQTNVNMTTNLGSTTQRNIPDVAMNANNVYVTYNSGSANLYIGTSCAAPLWAGFMALVNQQSSGMNLPSAGFINPAIYALANTTNYSACFNDITNGNNTWPGSTNYYAVPGYDLCTGLGSPAGTKFKSKFPGRRPVGSSGHFAIDGFYRQRGGGWTVHRNVPDVCAKQFRRQSAGLEPHQYLGMACGFKFGQAHWLPAAETNVTVNLALHRKCAGGRETTRQLSLFHQPDHTDCATPAVSPCEIGQSLVQDVRI